MQGRQKLWFRLEISGICIFWSRFKQNMQMWNEPLIPHFFAHLFRVTDLYVITFCIFTGDVDLMQRLHWATNKWNYLIEIVIEIVIGLIRNISMIIVWLDGKKSSLSYGLLLNITPLDLNARKAKVTVQTGNQWNLYLLVTLEAEYANVIWRTNE